MRSLRRLGIGTAIVFITGLLVVPPIAAQSGKDISRSLCQLYSKAQVREALQVRMAARPDPSYHDCTWSTVDIGDPERYLNIGWLGISFEDLQTVQPDWTPLTVAGRPALYDSVRPALNVSLDQGVLVLSINALQAGDWQAGLTGLGELAVAKATELVAPPPPDADLMALFPTIIGGQDLLMTPLYVDREFSAQSGDRVKALRSALKATGKKMGDVSLASGQVPDTGAYVAALRVAGADAAALAEAAIVWSIVTGWTAEPPGFVNGSVNAVTFADGSYARYVYPKDDIVWVVDAPEPALSEILAALPGAPSVPTAPMEPPAEPATGEAPAGDADARSAMPTTIGGVELQQQFTDSVGGFLSGRSLKLLDKALKATGKQQDDLSATIAQAPDGSVVIMGIDVDGADATAYLAFMSEVVLSGLPSRKHSTESAEVAGKLVTVIHPAKAKPGEDIHIYTSPGVVWMVVAKEPLLTEVFTALP